jgi:DNA-binding transcriptional regulator PaaX
VLVFDIPESHRKVRNVLRSRLKLWQFKPLQKSVWVSKKSIKKHIQEFINEVGLSQWVLVFESDDLTNIHISDDR